MMQCRDTNGHGITHEAGERFRGGRQNNINLTVGVPPFVAPMIGACFRLGSRKPNNKWSRGAFFTHDTGCLSMVKKSQSLPIFCSGCLKDRAELSPQTKGRLASHDALIARCRVYLFDPRDPVLVLDTSAVSDRPPPLF